MFHHFLKLTSVSFLFLVLLTVGCSAQQTEEQALQSLREMTREGKLPPEPFVTGLESRFAGKRTGALAKLLHARIRFENNDPAGAAAILNSDVFAKKTKVADHAMWLRAQALQRAGDHTAAMRVVSDMLRDHPDSLRARDARLLWAASAMQAGRAAEVHPFLAELAEKKDADALLLTAKAYETQGATNEAVKYFRRTYFLAAGSAAAKEAETKLTALGQALAPQAAEEQLARADRFLSAKNYTEASTAYADLFARFPAAVTPAVQLRRITALANANRAAEAQTIFNVLPVSAAEREEGYRQMALGYGKGRNWQQLRSTVDEMRQRFPNGALVPKALIEAGTAARDGKNRVDESYFLNTAITAYPNAVEVAQAQFDMAWGQHTSGNFAMSSQMFIDHLARYADKDTTNRGKAGYWAARDAERAGKTAEACALYDAVIYRYAANWYGHLALGRQTTMKGQGKCTAPSPVSPAVKKAADNLRTVTVAAETAGERELERAAKSEELSTVGLFDWAIDELQDAKKTAANSPKINLALAKHYRLKGDNVNALLALGKSYPDYAQMFPEEMGSEEWDIFYPLTNWNEIKHWAQVRGLDRYQVAGVIRQETIFNPRAASPANAYGLMQLLLPTAKTMARSYGATMPSSPVDLFQPALNIELGTAYMKDQFAKFGRIEYVAIAYNAGPGRVNPWRASLPPEMDEFVEAIPFKETKGYVQGIIRNSAQYRRLYDEDGNFKPNVGTRPLRGEIDTKSPEQVAHEFPEVVVDREPAGS